MPFAENWVETDPDGSIITVSTLDNWIRKTKTAVRERMESSLIKPGTWAATAEPYLRGTFSNGVIIRNSGDTANLVQVNDTYGILLGPGTRIRSADILTGNQELIFYSATSDTIAIGKIGDKLVSLCTKLLADFPGPSLTMAGAVGTDRTNDRFVYYSGNSRYYLLGTPF